ncbi:unnamed protein product [marine sediment metagenome]|uniref:DUF2958 domain-containing protein n=1 Tax=marine sediment metagenome TaxID=412755 RepID=X1S1G0_9ZZZZ
MKLMTKEILNKIPKLYEQDKLGDNAVVHVKFFYPWSNWTWYATEFDGKDIFFGLVDGHEIELGYFSLNELKSVKGPHGLGIERDLYFGTKTLKEIKDQLNN